LKRWLFCFALAADLCLAACSEQRTPIELAGRTMGTTWHVTYLPAPEAQRDAPDDIQQEIDGILENVNHSMSTYRSDSEISRFNGHAVDEWFAISGNFVTVLDAAMAVGEASEGAYDVTVGPLVDLWGFGPQARAGTVPDEGELTALLQQVGQRKLRLDRQGQKLLKTDDLSLDFSSVAKGYAVDLVADWLSSRGVDDFLVEVGGEMRLSGRKSGGELWRIAIENPDSQFGSIATAISLSDSAVATSGDYRNYFEVDGKRFSHTIDPRTGFPVEHDLVSVTVVHSRAMMADAWATALTVLGADRAMEVALAEDLAVYFIRREGDSYSNSYSPLFEAYLESTNGQLHE